MNVLIPVILIAGGATAYFTRKLTAAASVCGVIIALLIFFFAGWAPLVEMAMFFMLGTLATSWKSGYKEETGISAKQHQTRNMGQVLANAGTASLISLVAVFYKDQCLLAALIASSFSSATADTLSSELGSVYGKRFYNILTFKKDQRGLDGVISFEGTLAGITGSCIIALIHSLSCGWSRDFWLIIIAGTIGNLADSILGAWLERKHRIGNNAVNFLNTMIGATSFYALYLLF